MSDIARHAMRGMQCAACNARHAMPGMHMPGMRCAAFHAVKPAVIKRLELAQCNPPPP